MEESREGYSKLEKMFLPYAYVWDCYNDEPSEDNNPKKCADLAKRIAMDFMEYLLNNYTFDSIAWRKDKSKFFTTEELFNKFIVDYGKD